MLKLRLKRDLTLPHVDSQFIYHKQRCFMSEGQYDPKAIEKKWRDFWEKNKIPQKISEGKGKKFYLLDGPPYANQVAHVGHVKTRTVKDVIVKFKAMQGFTPWLQPGFDTHGLPIENMVEKEMGIKSKQDIEKLGVDKFIAVCRAKAEGVEKQWLEMYKQLGDFRGWFEPYLTLHNYYIESGWWTTKQMHDKGMLVTGEKPTFWCPHCQTALSGYEVTDSYADVKDPYVYVKFPIKGRKNEYIVIFTTTPWTLVSNVVIAIKPDEIYAKVKVGDEVYVVAEKRVEPLFKELLKVDYKIVEKFPGEELDGLKYSPVLDLPVQKELDKNPNAHKIILSIPVLKSKSYKHGLVGTAKMKKEESFDFVNMDEGSGAVHVAPGHGQEDNYVAQHYKLPIASPVDEEGKYTEDAGEFRGIFVKDADKMIADKLREKSILHFGWIKHSYPLCWRCKTPLIYRMSKQWFFAVDGIKDKMIKENEKVKWMPEFGKERERNWLNDVIDWTISQQRFWGIPLPVWTCEKCGKIDVIGGVDDLKKKAVTKLPKEIDLHKHVVDKIELKCDCGGKMKRVPDTMNVWFDAGIATWASLGYPYKNKELFDKLYPADFITEAQDQIRGWFYSLLFCGTSVFNQSPYKSVGLMGWLVDEKGEKMSKSLGNVVWASDALEKLGADILRMYCCWEVAPWEVQSFSLKTADEVRKALNILWNSYSFFTTYVTPNFKPKMKSLQIEDKWILSRLNSLVADVTNHLENFELHLAGRKMVDFAVSDLSRFYIKKIRDRVWVTESGEDKSTALSVLHHVLLTLSKLFAPITPFIAEEMYHGLEGKESVFQMSWPDADKKLVDKKLEENVAIVQKIVEASLSARQKAGLKLRWPVKEVIVVSGDKKISDAVKGAKGILVAFANAKGARVVAKEPAGEFSLIDIGVAKVMVASKLGDELMGEAMVRELTRGVQSIRKLNNFNVNESIVLTLATDKDSEKVLAKFKDDIRKEVGASKVGIGSLKGKYTGKVEFEGKKIEVAFDKK
ncbi:isoleucine--tRNA ligase [archaeon]|nr:MAG: isoleucine--tRNA ligase [archaeon]